jgi:hypothetical protein
MPVMHTDFFERQSLASVHFSIHALNDVPETFKNAPQGQPE